MRWRAALPGVIALLLPTAAPTMAWAHGGDRAFVLLLPTGYYLIGGTLAVILFARWTDHPGFAATLWGALPWWAGGAVLLKLLAAGWALRALLRRGLVEAPTLVKLLGVWLLLAVGLFTLVCGVIPVGFVPVPLIACGVVLSLPLARLAAAPLALAWNRHR